VYSLTENKHCYSLNQATYFLSVSGGFSEKCFMRVSFDASCTDFFDSPIGPIDDDPGSASCVGPYPQAVNSVKIHGCKLA
jgi:hypothetical protein